ncbi:hypothetical protein [Tenacibaculum soleae]|uniref:hypothetical protein n=1 Tax=Tenacibaculum soleae TaxID=447689 RepID=UPI002301E4AF|nr:hypothetical protein [Tenacibaculum soleae]
MEKQITVKNDYNTLDKVLNFLKTESTYECSKDYDSWDVRTDSNNKMEQCVVIRKSGMHGMKVYFPKENSLKMTHIIPNKLLNAYFGKSQKSHKNIIEIITGKISQAVLSGSQKKAFEEIEQAFKKIVE